MADNLSSSSQRVNINAVRDFFKKCDNELALIQSSNESSNKESEKEQQVAWDNFLAALGSADMNGEGRADSVHRVNARLHEAEESERICKRKADEEEAMLWGKLGNMRREFDNLLGTEAARACSREKDGRTTVQNRAQKRQAGSFSLDIPQDAKRMRLDSILNPFTSKEPCSGRLETSSFSIAQSSPDTTEQRRDSVPVSEDSIGLDASYEVTLAPNDCQDSQLPDLSEEDPDAWLKQFISYPGNGNEFDDQPCPTETDDCLRLATNSANEPNSLCQQL